MFSCRYFSLQHFEDILLFPPACKVSAGKSPDRFLRFPSYIPFSFLILPFRWKEGKKKCYLSAYPFPETVPTDPYPIGTCPKINQKVSFTYNPGTFKSASRVNEINSRVLVSCSTQLPQI